MKYVTKERKKIKTHLSGKIMLGQVNKQVNSADAFCRNTKSLYYLQRETN